MEELDVVEKSKLIQLQHESNSTKLDWMYGNPKHVESEDYLLGRAVDSTKNHVEHECIPPSIRDLKGPQQEDQVDLAKKLQEDPLVEIHRRQIEARKKMLQNPIKLKQMQQMLKKDEESSDDELNQKLLEKYMKLKGLAKKKKKKKSKKRDSDSDDHKAKKSKDSDSDHRKRKKSSKGDDEYKSKKSNKYDSDSDDNKRKKSKKYDSDSDDDKRKKKKTKKYESDSDDYKRKKSNHNSRNIDYDKPKSKRDSTPDDLKRSRRSSDRTRNSPKLRSSQERELQYEQYRNPSSNYGLVNAAGEKLHVSRSSHTNYSASRPRKVEEKPKAWVKPERKKLSEEEKEKRRLEMLENVQWKEKTRTKIKSKDEEPMKEYNPAFLKKYLLKHNESSSVESRIKSNLNNIQRRGADMDRNFARR